MPGLRWALQPHCMAKAFAWLMGWPLGVRLCQPVQQPGGAVHRCGADAADTEPSSSAAPSLQRLCFPSKSQQATESLFLSRAKSSPVAKEQGLPS